MVRQKKMVDIKNEKNNNNQISQYLEFISKIKNLIIKI